MNFIENFIINKKINIKNIGKYIYCAGEDAVLYIFDVKSSRLENVIQLYNNNNNNNNTDVVENTNLLLNNQSNKNIDTIFSIAHHPHRNLIASVGKKGNVQLFAA
jgi:hypothetical protein